MQTQCLLRMCPSVKTSKNYSTFCTLMTSTSKGRKTKHSHSQRQQCEKKWYQWCPDWEISQKWHNLGPRQLDPWTNHLLKSQSSHHVMKCRVPPLSALNRISKYSSGQAGESISPVVSFRHSPSKMLCPFACGSYQGNIKKYWNSSGGARAHTQTWKTTE